YQVFISSTFRDLIDERQAVLKAVLELNHMPAGMELFPAADETAWQLIKDVIDGSDYYVLIIAGRYGSLDEAGIGYTEKEYDYAVQTRKPVIPFLHQNPDNLPREKTETIDSAWNKLKAFRAKVEKKHTCVYWNSSEELKARVIVGLTSTVKRKPTVGWVRADQIPSDATISEILTLKKRVAQLEAEAAESLHNPPDGTEDLVQGDEQFEIKCKFKAGTGSFHSYDDSKYEGQLLPTWNQIFAAIAPSMINEASDHSLRVSFNRFFSEVARREFAQGKQLKGKELYDFKFKDNDIDTCIVQLRALGLIRENVKQRSVKDTGTYWKLTPYGDTKMVQLRAIRKTPIDESIPSKAEQED
ncbi:MAG: DUF4062 domain-containing protein, partial [Proteobacteria bacterium]|nr:DUF4062 domain-containing protein [Pseudomonadota bacterium]